MPLEREPWPIARRSLIVPSVGIDADIHNFDLVGVLSAQVRYKLLASSAIGRVPMAPEVEYDQLGVAKCLLEVHTLAMSIYHAQPPKQRIRMPVSGGRR